jgi:membrane fusion protein (multidrug efflux system)/multidrug efflux system membrane fusion protein
MKRLLLAVLVFAVIAGGIYYRKEVQESAPAPVVSKVESVSVQPVRVIPMIERVASYGNLVSERSVKIVPESSGTVRQILFQEGQFVQAGEPLVVLDGGIAEAQLQSARAQAEADLQNLRRTQSLTRQGLDSTYSLEQAQSHAAASQADVKINERKLAQYTLRAPFSGSLGTCRIDVGAFVGAGNTIVELQDTSKLQIEIRLPSTVAPRITREMPVYVKVPGTDAAPEAEGRLSFIDPAISTDTRSILLRAVVENTNKLRPGLYVRVSINLSTHEHALVLPVGAISTDLNGSYVYVVDAKNTAHQRAVTVGLNDGTNAEILTGVKEGELVVTIGQFRLRDGDEVKIVPAPADAKSAS